MSQLPASLPGLDFLQSDMIQPFTVVTITGTAGDDNLDGTPGDDLMQGLDGNDSLRGGLGQDTLVGGAGNDTLEGGYVDEGIDTAVDVADYSAAGVALQISRELDGLHVSGDGLGTDLLSSIELIRASDIDDVLTIPESVGIGIDGGGGNDTLEATDYGQSLYGSAGDDVLTAHAYGLVQGGAGNDTITGANSILSYADATGAIKLDTSKRGVIDTGGGGIDTLLGHFSQVQGSAFNDKLISTGTSEVSWLVGLGGDDLLDAGSNVDDADGGEGVDTLRMHLTSGDYRVEVRDFGRIWVGSSVWLSMFNVENYLDSDDQADITGTAINNLLNGGGGDDTIDGGGGFDTLIGGVGFDVVGFEYATAGVTLNLAKRGIHDTGGGGLVSLASFEGAIGSAYGDHIKAVGETRLYGMDGDDSLSSKDGADLLDGGTGGDALSSGKGDDTLIGGGGQDVMTSGGGADHFAFLATSDSSRDAPDLIRDLDKFDVIDLSAIDADTTKAGDQAFKLVDALDGHAGEVALVWDVKTKQTLLEADVNGDGSADFTIELTGKHDNFPGLVL